MERKTLITMMMIELTTLVSKRSSLKMKIRTRKRMILRTLSILMLSFVKEVSSKVRVIRIIKKILLMSLYISKVVLMIEIGTRMKMTTLSALRTTLMKVNIPNRMKEMLMTPLLKVNQIRF